MGEVETAAVALAGFAELCWDAGGLGSGGSVPSLGPDDDDDDNEGTSNGGQEDEGDGEPPRLVDEGELTGGTRGGGIGGGELPVEGAGTELRSNRSVTEPDSSPDN